MIFLNSLRDCDLCRFRRAGGGFGESSEERTLRMAERARLGEGMERLSEVGGVAPGGVFLASRGGKRAQKNPNNPKSWGAEQKDPILPQ